MVGDVCIAVFCSGLHTSGVSGVLVFLVRGRAVLCLLGGPAWGPRNGGQKRGAKTRTRVVPARCGELCASMDFACVFDPKNEATKRASRAFLGGSRCELVWLWLLSQTYREATLYCELLCA